MIDFTAFQRIDAPNSLGSTGTGASFATSTGDVLEVGCFGSGVFRIRLGPNTRPDYGLVVGRLKPCTVAQVAPDRWTFTAGDATLEIASAPLSFRLVWKGAPVESRVTCGLQRPDWHTVAGVIAGSALATHDWPRVRPGGAGAAAGRRRPDSLSHHVPPMHLVAVQSGKALLAAGTRQ